MMYLVSFLRLEILRSIMKWLENQFLEQKYQQLSIGALLLFQINNFPKLFKESISRGTL